MCFITSLFQDEENRNLFVSDLNSTMKGGSQHRFITETFAFPEKQIRLQSKYRYTMVNFSPVYRKSKPKNFLQETKNSFIAEPPLWALNVTKSFFKSELEAPNPGYLSNISVYEYPEEIELMSEFTMEIHNDISYIVTPEKIEVIVATKVENDDVYLHKLNYSYPSSPLLSSNRISFSSDLDMQSTKYNGFNDLICCEEPAGTSTRYNNIKYRIPLVSPKRISFSSELDVQSTKCNGFNDCICRPAGTSTRCNNFEYHISGICQETIDNQEQQRSVQLGSMQDPISTLDSLLDDECFEGLLLRRLRSKPELLKNIKDSDIIHELICRKRAKEGRVHFLQNRDQMTHQRINELNCMLNNCVQAVTHLIHPEGNYCLSEVSENDMAQKHVELSTSILQSIAQMKPKERRPQLSHFTTVFSKPQVERMLGELVGVGEGSISHREWTEARKHAKHPGVGKPIIPVFHKRCRVTNEALICLNEVFADNFQRFAFGTKTVKLEDGGMMATCENQQENTNHRR